MWFDISKQTNFFHKKWKVLGSRIWTSQRTRTVSNCWFGPCIWYFNEFTQLVKLNFGESEFEFNLQNLIDEEKKKEIEEINEIKINSHEVRKLVVSYLIQQGYKNTVNLLDEKNNEFELQFRYGERNQI
jgi:thiol-disulfide isomerase/thioredoxin